MNRKLADKLKPPLWVLLAGLSLMLAVGAVKPMLPHHAEGSLAAFWTEILSLFFAECGVALVIAYIIGLAVDAQQRRRDAYNLEQRREADRIETLEREQRMVQDVFRGVLGIRHSSAYVRKVVETTLEQRVIRRSVNLIYTLRRLNEEEAARIGDADRFMVLDEAMSYEFNNLSSDEFDMEIRLAVPVRHGKKLRDESRLQSATINGEPIKEKEMQEQKQEREGDAKEYVWKRKMVPHGKLAVALKVRLIKEESDTEVWCSFYPCSEGMTLQVVAPSDLHMGIRNNTASRSRMETDPSDNGVGVWKIDGPILPNDSVVFYWRTRIDEGEGDDEPALDGAAASSSLAPESALSIGANSPVPDTGGASAAASPAMEQAAPKDVDTLETPRQRRRQARAPNGSRKRKRD